MLARVLTGRSAGADVGRWAASIKVVAMSNVLKSLVVTLVLLCGFVPARSWATAQTPDILLLDGKEEKLYTSPLVAYLSAHPDALPKSEVVSSGNWRGYVASWAIDGERLVLSRITITVTAAQGEEATRFVAKDVTSAMFPKGTPVEAAWYSGALVIPRGEQVQYVHMGYASIYERYTILSIKAGRVTSRRDLRMTEFERYRDQKFQAFKKTKKYQTQLAKLRKEDGTWSTSEAESFLKAIYAEEYLSQ